MPRVTFLRADGRRQGGDLAPGESVMMIGQRLDILEGACGGALACATCHVILDAEAYDRFGEPSPEEEDMLDFAEGVGPTSRLGCQLRPTGDLVCRVPH
ncbi:2Fe-2S iron-sulfur cluster-binding protein [Marinivivus vitaminiproducens]|uniref:2Fe-2S iron-sulfur cluster-binding protein n=1 Tax=Marinivivus vitaminiproducens TaxID=3035935 RepID=UPI0027A6C4A9|nr:2Fe-2S iron-sulfur cluster-binding protein [Geminicoccaceae bacterium SCSIO 64248]